ncbi:ribosomal protein L22 [Thermobaculum terrenum ATCC BAA-798]|uniref:Large ribosomal subunit protein uL22 n=1 Tax=Thermobaculum terrenum (strain ATCC BAA-798 / CCMEE 7001 / YNP1) TaxID=525904 RepID=D1CFD1_THET1|nr:50S ribosomal protein L22 [Thermobaculum terrenum]ACZ41637.1 ribosomal protein L22 [Thermobaculum terrenum ATCC BAA-798]
MKVRATTRYVRTSPRKARLVADVIRGKSVGEALAILRYTNKAVARDFDKLLRSAIANAENNYELDADTLYVAEVYADDGPRFKRWRPASRGRAHPYVKRTSHLTVVLDQR